MSRLDDLEARLIDQMPKMERDVRFLVKRIRRLEAVAEAARSDAEGWGYGGGPPTHQETHSESLEPGLTKENCRCCALETALASLDAGGGEEGK